ncbi:MAG: lysylphosphatidylglycerol synthase transmembrane domain-containing protein [Baekduia sp.]
MAPAASLGDDLTAFGDAVSSFTDQLSHISAKPLLVGLAFFIAYLSMRAAAFRNILRAAYPEEPIPYKLIWGAYIAAYGFNNVVPARGGDVIKVFLTKQSVPHSTYPAIGATLFVESVFDAVMGVFILTFAFTQGVFPRPPDWADLNAFDLSYFADNPQMLLFVLTALAVLSLVLFAWLGQRVARFWARVRQGLTILWDRPRYMREVFGVQFAAWCLRFTAFWFLLDAFHIGGSVKNVLLVLGVNAVAAAVPFTPGGAGVQQAFLVKVFAETAGTATVAAYSVGQQVAIAITAFVTGFLALLFIFRFRSFGDVIRAGREHRDAEKAERV